MAPAPVRGKRVSLRSLARSAAILVVAGLTGVVSLSSSVAQIYSREKPQRALAWAPNDARAKGQAAALLAARSETSAHLAMARKLAVDAAAEDPTVIAAFRALGLIAEVEHDDRVALAYFTHAAELSRRDRPTQLWFIGYYERENDENAFVHQFDVALRTSPSGLDELLPVLVSATAEPRLLPPLRRALAADPPWSLAFMVQLISFGPDLSTVVALTEGQLDPKDDYQRSLIEALIGRLVKAGEFGLASRVLADAAPGAPAGAIWGGDFEAQTDFAPFGWDLADEEELFAVRAARPDGGDGYALLLTAFNGKTGTVARQLLRLAPGDHRLYAEVGDVPEETFARPRVRLSCAVTGSGGGQLLEVIPTAGSAPKRINAPFRVPAGCGWQWLTIDLAGQGVEAERSPWVDDLAARSATAN